MDQQTSITTESDLRQVLRPVWSRKWLILAAVAIATAITYQTYDRQARQYRAGTSLFLSTSQLEQSLGTSFFTDDRTTANQAALMTSSAVIREVAKRVGYQGAYPRELAGGLGVSPRAGQDFIDITYVSTDPLRAAKMANVFAEAFIEIRSTQLRSKVVQSRQTAERQLAVTPPTAVSERADLSARIRQLRVVESLPSGNAEQIDRATPPGVPFAPNPKRNATFAAIIALFLSVAAAFGLNRFDRRVRTVEDLENAYGAPVIGVLPRVADPASLDHGHAVMPALFREPFRSLRTNVELAALDRNLKVLLVISAVSGEGKSTVVRNLALAYAEAGLRVVIIEGDVRRPAQTQMLNVDRVAGLTNVVANQLELREALREIDFGQTTDDGARLPVAVGAGTSEYEVQNEPMVEQAGTLHLLSSGPEPPNPPVVLGSDRMTAVLERLGESYDMVLIDSAPLLVVSDAVPLIGQADGTIVVGRIDETYRHAARRVRDVVSRIPNGNLLGVVANEVTSGEFGGGYRYYGYGRGPRTGLLARLPRPRRRRRR